MADATAAPGQGAPATAVQPGAPGQGDGRGQPTAAGKGDGQPVAGQFDWGLFPDVPEAQREMLAPHLKGVQSHVTKLEGQYAPYKGLTETVGPDQVSNLVGFLQGYQNDPVATWLGMAQDLQSQGTLPATVDLQAVEAMLQGQAQAQAQAQPGQEDIPQWAQELKAQADQQKAKAQQEEQARQQQQVEQQNEEILNSAKTGIRATLNTAGIEESIVPDEMIVASIIANNGDEQAAAAQLTGLRDSFLSSFTQANGGAPKAPAVKGTLPQPGRVAKKGDGFDKARDGAKQFLAQRQAAAAQE